MGERREGFSLSLLTGNDDDEFAARRFPGPYAPTQRARGNPRDGHENLLDETSQLALASSFISPESRLKCERTRDSSVYFSLTCSRLIVSEITVNRFVNGDESRSTFSSRIAIVWLRRETAILRG